MDKIQGVYTKEFYVRANVVLSESYVLTYEISKRRRNGHGTNLASKHLV